MSNVLSINPSTGEVTDTGWIETSADDVAQTCAEANRVAAQWAALSLDDRSRALVAMADELDADGDNIVALADEETGLGVARLSGELRRTSFQFRFLAGVVREGAFLEASVDHATDSAMGPLPDLRRQLEPLGVVAVFGASNFPLAFSVPGGDTASALASGCAVVAKAHPAHPRTSVATFEALRRGLEKCAVAVEVIGLVFGLEAGTTLVRNPHIGAVGFTGSVGAGRALCSAVDGRPRPIPLYGELGSVNPVVVTCAAVEQRADEIGRGLVASVSLGAGQFCTKPGVIFVPQNLGGDQLVKSAAAAMTGWSGATMLTSAIRDRVEDGLDERSAAWSQIAVSQVPISAAGGRGALYEVSIGDLKENDHELLSQECFGPVAIIVRYHSLNQVGDLLRRIDPALTLTVQAGDNDGDVAEIVKIGAGRAGRVIVNAWPTGVAVSWSMHHGGPFPASTSSLHTSVGATSLRRWLRPVAYQGVPESALPTALRDDNPWSVTRRVDGQLILGPRPGTR